ncbi:MAG: 50S ribosomal protein L21e [Nanoarchaeota archaeon]|nr:50S ribosomal protein L21e [Nanoarchaeota archaeon]|tara:strand:- start:1290 stop:1589 length:300 start_codon:yes stop_codon:yes gene_type:complete
MKRTGTARRKTRSLFKKNIKTKGKISIRNYLQTFKDGEKVLLKAEPAKQNGMYFRRFHGMTGEIIGKQGTNYKIKLKDKNAIKQLIVHPVHLRKCQTKK